MPLNEIKIRMKVYSQGTFLRFQRLTIKKKERESKVDLFEYFDKIKRFL